MWIESLYKDCKQIKTTLCKKAGVKYFRFHTLKHTGATIMDSNNVHLGAIQSILRNENRATTEIFYHNSGSSEIDAMDVYENARTLSHANPNT